MEKRWSIAGMVILSGLIFWPDVSDDEKKVPYANESQLYLPGTRQQVWAVCATQDLSGQKAVDPLLQSDMVFAELQQVHGLAVIPVNRVVEVYSAMRLEKVQNEQQARAICQALGCDGLVVPTVTAYDPYDPPMMGASLLVFCLPGAFGSQRLVDPHTLVRSPRGSAEVPESVNLSGSIQVVGMYDSRDGSVRRAGDALCPGPIRCQWPLRRPRGLCEHGSLRWICLSRTD